MACLTLHGAEITRDPIGAIVYSVFIKLESPVGIHFLGGNLWFILRPRDKREFVLDVKVISNLGTSCWEILIRGRRQDGKGSLGAYWMKFDPVNISVH